MKRDNSSVVLLSAMLLAAALVVIIILALHLKQAQLQIEHLKLQVIEAPPQIPVDEMCAQWLFNTNLNNARHRICKGR